jgi:hypothetical protein
MPRLHSPVVSAMVPSMSILAQSKKLSGCFAQTIKRVSLMMSIKVYRSERLKRRQ